MSDPINANPTVLDVSQLPTRESKEDEIINKNDNIEKIEESLIYQKFKNLSLLPTSNKQFDNNNSNNHDGFNNGNGFYSFDIVPELIQDDESSVASSMIDTDTDTIMNNDAGIVSGDYSALFEYNDNEGYNAGGNDGNDEEDQCDPIDAQEIYDLISTISDPEHPLTLGQLAVVNLNDIEVKYPSDKTQIGEIEVKITPTITHCSLATLIGLGIRVRLERSLPIRMRITILLKEGSHQSEHQINKQLNDKERVAAACENDQLLKVISHMLSTCK
ncbi:hypothetical protein B5S28_g5044 [[Candida] boidinii]|uniref:Unnamed protein product n=1 Tax=Candida boidinii TaxID=5477 RepID=A0ACB5TM22_CANBO|nr:hypothetical protein B5S28_g5044 [[Candida] boidinii]OWB61252.1 hypothetical protein B5S29_g2139 [[Candida] boidinii]OWB73505.1 hypothetical protein B5S31_g3251 [[Candida] boidinii]OWB78173.1 hypothetical protein B5S32_g2361 [[Candida] boidinii]GME90038.1 unnamed protein product [[Candida] boidinii]